MTMSEPATTFFCVCKKIKVCDNCPRIKKAKVQTKGKIEYPDLVKELKDFKQRKFLV